jgi:hypothetical protein
MVKNMVKKDINDDTRTLPYPLQMQQEVLLPAVFEEFIFKFYMQQIQKEFPVAQ